MSDIRAEASEIQSWWDAQWDEDGNGPWDISAETWEHPAPEDLLELIESGFKHGAALGFKAGAHRVVSADDIQVVIAEIDNWFEPDEEDAYIERAARGIITKLGLKLP